jgi:putative peptidoglycan lipid II flippase
VIVRDLARAGAIVGVAFLVSRALGWLRLVVIANLPVERAELDAYFAAFRIPDLIYQLVAAGAIGSALIPVLTGLIHEGDEGRASRLVSSVLNAMLIALTLLGVLVFIFAPQIVPWMVPGFDEATTETTVRLTRIMVASPILLALGAVASAVLNTRGRFFAASMAPVLYNGAIIAAALLLAPVMGIDALAVGVVIGAVLFLAAQVRPLTRWLRYEPIVDRADAAVRRVVRLLVPRALALGASQITFVVNTLLATFVAVGAVTIYTIATTIFIIPVGVMGMPMAFVLLPPLSRAVAAGDIRQFGALLVGGLRLLVYVMLFLSAVGIVLSRQIVELLFGYGAFDAQALDLTAGTLAIMLGGLAGNALCLLLARAFFSHQDTTTPLLGVVLCVTVNVAVSLATVGQLGLLGLALGVMLGDWAEAIFLVVMIWRRVPSVAIVELVRAIPVMAIGALLAAGAAAAALFATTPAFGQDPGKVAVLLQLVLATLAGGAAYLLYTRILRLPELPRAVALVRSSLRRGGTATG